MTDAVLAALAGALLFTTIKTLILSNCKHITDVGIAALAAKSALSTLDLSGTAATVAGIVAVAAEGKLASLVLHGGRGVDDSIAAALAGCSSKRCFLSQSELRCRSPSAPGARPQRRHHRRHHVYVVPEDSLERVQVTLVTTINETQLSELLRVAKQALRPASIRSLLEGIELGKRCLYTKYSWLLAELARAR